MPLSWNEIRNRAFTFSKDWEGETSESAEAKTFWDAFFNIYGVTRRRIATFETPIKKEDGQGGYIDLLWRGVLLVEHKSLGKNLDSAYKQALDYFPGLKERDLPRYVVVSDFANFRLYDLDQDEIYEIPLKELHNNIHLFGFIAGYQTRSYGEEDPVNIKAAEALGKLHDQLLTNDYKGHALEVLLVRLLFCLFAEDTGIFERRIFQDYIELRTTEDGTDLGMHLTILFQVLDREENKRQKNLDEQLSQFPYINGKLFEETLPVAAFNKNMRETLLDCCALNWSRISPAVFGSLFQSIMDDEKRRNLGAHYTSESNILKVLNTLFLDNLHDEFESIKNNNKRLINFHVKLSRINIFDPACGCGNFLTVAYRELRLLELEVLRKLYKAKKDRFLDIDDIIILNVDQFYGIELEEFPSQIAQVSLWLTDHQVNMIVSEEFGQTFFRLPLIKSANIYYGNALRYKWTDIIDPNKLSYIVGNPPFVGSKLMDEDQRKDIKHIFNNIKNSGILDYVACWYIKAAEYMMKNKKIRTAFVSTNSITQGEQVGVLWGDLCAKGIIINFAHRTFKWNSEARGKAAVHCVIIGFAYEDEPIKYLYDYESVNSEPHLAIVKSINPYLVEGSNDVITSRSTPLCSVPEIGIGNKPIDDGNYLFTNEEMNEFVSKEPLSKKYFHPWLGSSEFLNGTNRWCLWLGNCPPDILRRMPECMKRIEAVKQFRLKSKSKPTNKLASTPTRFHVENMPSNKFLLIPRVSSERRIYAPIGFINESTFVSDAVLVFPNATFYHFGVLSSIMHNAWMRSVCGRLKSDYRYSAGIVYNNFPWPKELNNKKNIIENNAKNILNIRNKYKDSTLADLYDPLVMPSDLLKAHHTLDDSVDAAYGRKKYKNESERISFLFNLYTELKHGSIN